MDCPFTPRSTSHLRQGHYWCFQLSNRRIATGVVLARATYQGKMDRRMFLAGLLDWSGETIPVSDELRSSKVLTSGFAHIDTILRNGGKVLGIINRDWDTVAEVEYKGLGGTLEGPNIWAFKYIRAVAEHHFGDREWTAKQFEAAR